MTQYSKAMLAKIMSQPSPCDDCKLNMKCTYEDVACETFKQYVSTGKIKDLPRIPDHHIYFKLYIEDIKL